MKRAIYPGTFDPFTKGHEDILKRALKVFDEITVLVAVSPSKKALFSQKERVEMIEETFLKDSRVKVDSWDGLVVEYAKSKGIQALVRGLRPTGDFEMEFQMASMNNTLSPKVESVFFMTGEEHFFISSSLVREVFGHGGDISNFVPKEVLTFLESQKRV